MVKQITKVVIPAAGLGTRFLPATKAQPKEMLPIVDKPSIQYVVEEAVAAGLHDILIITGRGKRSIEDHFDRSFELEYYLEEAEKTAELNQVKEIASLGNIHYLRQGAPLGLGHAVLAAQAHISNEPFAVMLADDIMEHGSTLLQDMLRLYSKYGQSVLALMEVKPSEISNYGCVDVERMSETHYRIRGVVEKPAPNDAPSNLAIIGRYVFTPEIFTYLQLTRPGRNGEIQLTDAIGGLLEKQEIIGVTFSEMRFDIGNKNDYLRATIEMALSRPDLRQTVLDLLSSLSCGRALKEEARDSLPDPLP